MAIWMARLNGQPSCLSSLYLDGYCIDSNINHSSHQWVVFQTLTLHVNHVQVP